MSAIKITPELLADIEAKARSATPGPWAIMYGGQPGDSYAVVGSCSWNRPVCGIEPVNYKIENAKHIAAANPAVVLAMIERIRRLEEERQAAVDALHQWVWGVEHDDKTEVENAFEQAKEIAKKGGAE